MPVHQLEQLLSLSGQPCSLQVHSAVVQAPFDKVFSLAVLGGADKELVCVSGRGLDATVRAAGATSQVTFPSEEPRNSVFWSDIWPKRTAANQLCLDRRGEAPRHRHYRG